MNAVRVLKPPRIDNSVLAQYMGRPVVVHVYVGDFGSEVEVHRGTLVDTWDTQCVGPVFQLDSMPVARATHNITKVVVH